MAACERSTSAPTGAIGPLATAAIGNRQRRSCPWIRARLVRVYSDTLPWPSRVCDWVPMRNEINLHSKKRGVRRSESPDRSGLRSELHGI